MTENDSGTMELTRRKALGSMAIVGAAGAGAGAGSWAAWNDTADSENNYVEAGTLGVEIDGEEPVTSFEVDNAAPGDSETEVHTLENTGSIDGNLSVELTITNEVSSGGANEALAEDLTLTVGEDDENEAPVIDSTADTADGESGSLGTLSGNGGSIDVAIGYDFDENSGNESQDGRVEFDVAFTLEQT